MTESLSQSQSISRGGQPVHPRSGRKITIRQMSGDLQIPAMARRVGQLPEAQARISAALVNHTYALKVVNDHLIAAIAGYSVLVDSGAPMTLGRAGRYLPLAGYLWDIPEKVGTWNTEILSREVGHRVDVLLGMDIMGEHYTLIDAHRGTISLSDHSLVDGIRSVQHLDTNRWGLSPTLGVKHFGDTIELKEAGDRDEDGDSVNLRLIVDTGSKLLYVPREDAARFPVSGSEPDFYIGLGGWTHPTHRRVVLTPGGDELVCRAGYLPRVLESMTMQEGFCGILGIDLFKQFSVQIAPDETSGLQMSIVKPEAAAAGAAGEQAFEEIAGGLLARRTRPAERR